MNERDLLVHGVAWIEGRFGYNTHARNFFDRLSRLKATTVTPLVGLDGPIDADNVLIEGVFSGERDIVSIALLFGVFAEQALAGASGPRIGYTVWESTRYPEDWLRSLESMDRVWVPTHWGRDVLLANGMAPGLVSVVPEGVDAAVFNPDVSPAEAIASSPGFKFLNIGRYEKRKGTRDLILAFDAEFGTNDDVLLVIACDNPHATDFDLTREIRSLGLRHPENLVFVPPVARHDSLVGLYTACDAFVSPFRAEGWGLPIMEAMACDLPVIVTDYSGPTEFLGDHAYRLDYNLVDIDEPYFEVSSGNLGQWAEPDFMHLRHQMREVFQNREKASELGRRGGQHAREKFSWEMAAQVAARLIEELV